MSLDQVDDLGAAEDLIWETMGELGRVVMWPEVRQEDRPLLLRLRNALDGYCRPSCGMHGTPHVGPIEGWVLIDDGCGCPCHTRS